MDERSRHHISKVYPKFAAQIGIKASGMIQCETDIGTLANGLSRISDRLEAGAKTYGDSSFDRSFTDILIMMQEECLDIPGWGSIAWAQTQNAEIVRIAAAALCLWARLERMRRECKDAPDTS